MRETSRLPTPDFASVNAGLAAGRLLAVLALFPNGFRKIATFGQTAAGMGGQPQLIGGRPFPDQIPLFYFPFPELFLGVSIVLDLVGALLIVTGWRTRTVAFVLAGYVILAMTIYHSDIRHAQDLMHILRNLPFVGALLMLAAVGGGHWSMDGLVHRTPTKLMPGQAP